jgi:glycosidase
MAYVGCKIDCIVNSDKMNLQIGNAGTKRIASRSNSDSKTSEQFELWNMLLLMLPGSLNTYYGDEIGMTNGMTTGDTVSAINTLCDIIL